MKTSFAVVPDTNVVIAFGKSESNSSPNREFFDRWKNFEFEVLYSDDTLLEYIEKTIALGVPEEIVRKLIRSLLELGRKVRIVFFHLPVYPPDLDDIAFLVCAENGNATHIVTYDKHLKEVRDSYAFKVCGTLEFLYELRYEISLQTKGE